MRGGREALPRHDRRGRRRRSTSRTSTSPRRASPRRSRSGSPSPTGRRSCWCCACSSHGWLEEHTMHVLRTRLIERLRKADRHGRFRVYYPHVPGLQRGLLPRRALQADDRRRRVLRVGSANLCNRSIGLDTECDVAIEARGRPQVANVIRALPRPPARRAPRRAGREGARRDRARRHAARRDQGAACTTGALDARARRAAGMARCGGQRRRGGRSGRADRARRAARSTATTTSAATGAGRAGASSPIVALVIVGADRALALDAARARRQRRSACIDWAHGLRQPLVGAAGRDGRLHAGVPA